MIGGLKIISVTRLYLLITSPEKTNKQTKHCAPIKVIFLSNRNF